MDQKVARIVKTLSGIQANLREELCEKLEDQDEELEHIFDPYSFSPVAQDLREKYLNQLMTIQGIIQQLAHHCHAQQKQKTKVVRLSSSDQSKLVKLVNQKLASMNGSRVMDVNFMDRNEDGKWVALITYTPSPFAQQSVNLNNLM
jgi:hypothetical protein